MQQIKIGSLIEYYSILFMLHIIYKKNKMLQFVATWIDFENINLSEMSQTENAKNHVIHSYVRYNTEISKLTNIKKNPHWFVKGTEGQYTMMEKYFTLGRGHTKQYMDDVSQNYILEIYIILLNNGTPNTFN